MKTLNWTGIVYFLLFDFAEFNIECVYSQPSFVSETYNSVSNQTQLQMDTTN